MEVALGGRLCGTAPKAGVSNAWVLQYDPLIPGACEKVAPPPFILSGEGQMWPCSLVQKSYFSYFNTELIFRYKILNKTNIN